jgi:hypothetical protein
VVLLASDRGSREHRVRASRSRLSLLAAAGLAAFCLDAAPARAGNTVRISGLSDVAFGSISSFAADSVQSESLCLYSKSPPTNNYRITASGSGPGGTFVLSSGSATLPFEVQWSDSAGRTSGSQLLPNQPLTGQHSSAGAGSPDDCSSGPATTASLIVILRSAALSTAASGTYSGTLSLLVAPE